MTAAHADLIPDFPRRRPSPAGPAWPDEPTAHRTIGQPATVTDVTGRIAARQIVDDAKQLLMTVGNLTEPEAHRWIQKTAMDRRAGKRSIALGIIQAMSDRT